MDIMDIHNGFRDGSKKSRLNQIIFSVCGNLSPILAWSVPVDFSAKRDGKKYQKCPVSKVAPARAVGLPEGKKHIVALTTNVQSSLRTFPVRVNLGGPDLKKNRLGQAPCQMVLLFFFPMENGNSLFNWASSLGLAQFGEQDDCWLMISPDRG